MNPAAKLQTCRPPKAAGSPARLHRLVAAAMLPMALGACAPDAWKPSAGQDAFLDQVQRACGNQRMGEATVNDMLDPNSPMFSVVLVDVTSRWNLGKISTAEYIQSVKAVHGGPDSAGLKCILAQKPQ